MDPRTFHNRKQFEVHSRPEHSVQHLTSSRDDTVGLHFVHISALTIACRRLWIGTGNGVILSVPLTNSITKSSNPISTKPSSVVRLHDQLSPSKDVPYCNINDVQISFHGFGDAVKFFIALPGQPPSKLLNEDRESVDIAVVDMASSPFGDILVVSGGDGYNDFHVGSGNPDLSEDSAKN